MDQIDYNSDRYKRAYNLVLKHYWRQVWRNKKPAIPGIALPAIGSVFVFYIPTLIVTKLISNNHAGKDFIDYLPYILLFAGSWLFGESLWRVGIYFINRVDIRSMIQLYEDGLAQLLRHDIAFFHDNFAGSLTKRSLSYANRFEDVFDTLVFNVLPNLVPTIFAAIVLSFYSPWLSICLVAWLFVAVATIIPRIRKRQGLVAIRETAHTVASGHIADVYGNIDAVRAHATEKRELKRNSIFVKDWARKALSTWDFQNFRIDSRYISRPKRTDWLHCNHNCVCLLCTGDEIYVGI
jgi:ATP-binding cassette subfamily B protein